MCNIEIKLVFSISKIVCLLSVKDPTLNGFVQATCTIFLVQAVVPATAVKLPETYAPVREHFSCERRRISETTSAFAG